MHDEGRISTFDWQRHNLYHVLHQPAEMTAQQLHNGTRQAHRWFYGTRRRNRRFGHHMMAEPRFDMALAACNRNYDRHYRKLELDDMGASTPIPAMWPE